MHPSGLVCVILIGKLSRDVIFRAVRGHLVSRTSGFSGLGQGRLWGAIRVIAGGNNRDTGGPTGKLWITRWCGCASALATEVGVPQPTLSCWLRRWPMRRVETMKDESKRPEAKKRTAEQKLRIVLEATRLPDDELEAYLSRQGQHEARRRGHPQACCTSVSACSRRCSVRSMEWW